MKDILDQEIEAGDIIAISTATGHGQLKTGIVLELVKKPSRWNRDVEVEMVRVFTKGSSRWGDTWPGHLLVLDKPGDSGFYLRGIGNIDVYDKVKAYFNLYRARQKYNQLND